MKSIAIDDLQIHSNTDNSIGYYVYQNISGLEFPDVRISYYEKPGEYGAYVSNQLYGARLVTLEGTVFGSSLAEFNQRRRTLQSTIQITKDANSTPIAKTLKFTTMDDLALQATCYARKFNLVDVGLLNARFYIELYCPDFGLESQSLKSYTISAPVGGGAVLPWILPVVFSGSTGGTQIVSNAGNANAFPILTLTGPLTSPVVTNQTTGKYMSLNMTIASGSTVTINMKEKTILQGSTPVVGNKNLASEWWWVQSGDNTISLSTGSTGDTGNVQIEFRDTYIGV